MAGHRRSATRSKRTAASADSEAPGVRGLRFLIVGVGLLGVVAFLLFMVRGSVERQPGDELGLGDDPETMGFGPATRSFTLCFADADGKPALERREIVTQQSSAEQMRALVEELLAGSVSGHTPVFPAGTRVRNLFAGAGGVVFVDLTREAARGQVGGSSAEYASLVGLARTVLSNFPDATGVQVLLDGEPAATLAGHYSIERPLLRGDWALP